MLIINNRVQRRKSLKHARRTTLLTKGISKQISQKEQEDLSSVQWIEYLRKNESIIGDILLGQTKATVRCPICGYISYTFQSAYNLELSIPEDVDECTLKDLLKNYMKEEQLETKNWHCPSCNANQNGIKKIELFKLPPVLIIVLKRFTFDKHKKSFHKINTVVKLDFNGESFENYAESNYFREHNTMYHPFAFIVSQLTKESTTLETWRKDTIPALSATISTGVGWLLMIVLRESWSTKTNIWYVSLFNNYSSMIKLTMSYF